jgi:hypothetical protein
LICFSDHQSLIRQSRDYRKAAFVASGDDITLRQRSGGNDEIVRTDRRSLCCKLGGKPSMDTGGNGIKRKDREPRQIDD